MASCRSFQVIVAIRHFADLVARSLQKSLSQRRADLMSWRSLEVDSLVKDDTQERSVDLKIAVVLYETQFPELIHEKIDPRACCANHLR